MKRLLWLIALVCFPQAAHAQGAYSMLWSSIGGAAGKVGGGNYSVEGIAATPEAGSQQGGNYTLLGGYWVTGATVAAEKDPIPKSFAFRAPMPSPFRDRVAFAFELPEAGRVSLLVHSVDGRLVRKLVDSEFGAGRHTVFWNAKDEAGRDVRSGIYFVRISAGTFTASRRFVRLD